MRLAVSDSKRQFNVWKTSIAELLFAIAVKVCSSVATVWL